MHITLGKQRNGLRWKTVTVTIDGSTISEDIEHGKEARTLSDEMFSVAFDLHIAAGDETDVQFMRRIIHDFLSAGEFDELMQLMTTSKPNN